MPSSGGNAPTSGVLQGPTIAGEATGQRALSSVAVAFSPTESTDTTPAWRQHSISDNNPTSLHLLLHVSPHTILHASYTHQLRRTTAPPGPWRGTPTSPGPRPPRPRAPSIGSATTARTMSSALTRPKMTGLPVHVRYVTPLGRVASSARSPKRPMIEARKKEYSITPGLNIREGEREGRGGGTRESKTYLRGGDVPIKGTRPPTLPTRA